MIGMDFGTFLVLLVISAVVAAVLHFGFKYYVRPGLVSFFSKVIMGWFGAWLGSPVFGHWFESLKVKGVYLIPAILGSLAILIFIVDVIKTKASATKSV
jgi:uncharacterized membrane protein YeaQ/YmgE (transglycosylase-associated protein family)